MDPDPSSILHTDDFGVHKTLIMALSLSANCGVHTKDPDSLCYPHTPIGLLPKIGMVGG